MKYQKDFGRNMEEPRRPTLLLMSEPLLVWSQRSMFDDEMAEYWTLVFHQLCQWDRWGGEEIHLHRLKEHLKGERPSVVSDSSTHHTQ